MLGKGYADVAILDLANNGKAMRRPIFASSVWTERIFAPVSFAVVIFKEIKCLTRPPEDPPETTRLRYERSRKCTFCSCWGLASLGRELRHLDLQPNRSQPLGLEQVLWSRRGCCPSFLPS